MKCDGYVSPAFINNTLHNVPYNPLLAASASSSLTSVWSDASSQQSDDTTLSASTSDSDSCGETYCFSQPPVSSQSSASSLGSSYEPVIKLANPWHLQHPQQQASVTEAPAELRQNPRRTCHSLTSRTGCPPPLVRQADRKVNFVDALVDSSTHIVEAIWPTSSVICRNESGNSGVLPLRTFIQETLRRSRTSYSTLQVALYYLVLIKPHVPERDFTMEQIDDCHATRAIQCGRRMFLAALILASKYLQDRNYSARAWSKISGLNTQEINQNEIAFLLAVDWKLHITDEIYNRWTECVMKFTPSQPPSPGDSALQLSYERQCKDFRKMILGVTPELDNLDEVAPWAPLVEAPTRSLYTPPNDRVYAFAYEGEPSSLTPKPHGAPVVLEPTPATVCTPGRLAPALGLLPTPRLTPQTSGFNTPAVSAASHLLGKSLSMGLALAMSSTASQALDRWPGSTTSSPQSYFARRSSLANSISTASSPESMVSDSSRLSRSSSISSASSSISAPSSKLDVQARCRYAKLCSERLSVRPTIASVPEVYEEDCLTASPETYTGPVGKESGDSFFETTLGRRQREMNDAAQALQDLHRNGAGQPTSLQARIGLKRRRPVSIDNSLQENVREMLASRYLGTEASWPDTLLRPREDLGRETQQVPIGTTLRGSRKRLCCSAEAAAPYRISSFHPAMGGIGGPGMWSGILN
ncbi:hypothetical protein QBC46DRAFT_45900 [Diplogelasinospora grovesii]|uniref:G1/S-specific cyclin pas1 n=1 Tax=Diplogelasinospora grovesii TaxID=303347 RepID=A0AAN6S0K3_9PEZI|nr:hypothetical protein QBC46DRAFT_45900 [Diplogelasinospora grovesii]